MYKGKVLFIDTTHPLLPQMLEDAGFLCEHFLLTDKKDCEQIIHEYDIAIIRSKFYIDEEFFSYAAKLKIIGRVGSGLENIDLHAAKKHHVICLNSPEGNRDAVGEHAIGMLLALNNKLCIANNQVRRGIWLREENRGTEIRGKTIGIIGFGNMGRSFAEKLMGFGCNIIAYDKYKSQYAPFYVTEVNNLEIILQESDIISLHVPLTNETQYMVNKDFLNKCKQNAIIINTSRGKVLETAALVQSMKEEKIYGACLDVSEFESTSFEEAAIQNPDFAWLCQSDKVILTPHIAGWTHESNIKLSRILAEKVIQSFAATTN